MGQGQKQTLSLAIPDRCAKKNGSCKESQVHLTHAHNELAGQRLSGTGWNHSKSRPLALQCTCKCIRVKVVWSIEVMARRGPYKRYTLDPHAPIPKDTLKFKCFTMYSHSYGYILIISVLPLFMYPLLLM